MSTRDRLSVARAEARRVAALVRAAMASGLIDAVAT